jgi:alkylation response protein AidB-like acyl-CoA dehydrogenase
MTMRFAPLAHLRSTQPTSHLQAYSATNGMRPSLAASRSATACGRRCAQAGCAAHQVLEAIQILVNLHGGGRFAESSPMQQFWRDANTAARHTALNAIIGYKVYPKALLGVDEVVTRMI